MNRKSTGFTLVEIMIVVAIIGLLAAIAVPSFMKARASARRNACINNMRQIEAAKDEYALEYGGTNGETLSWNNVALYVKDITNKMYCPAATDNNRNFSNSYNLQTIGVDPTCKIMPGDSADPNHSTAYKAK